MAYVELVVPSSSWLNAAPSSRRGGVDSWSSHMDATRVGLYRARACALWRLRARHVSSPTRRQLAHKRRPVTAPVVMSLSAAEQVETEFDERASVTSEDDEPTWDEYMTQRPTTRKVKGELSRVGAYRPKINWYPGHIAKAERELRSKLGLVDVVLEVRDARIPTSTRHPSVDEWLGEKLQRVVVLNRVDMVSKQARAAWTTEMHRQFSGAESGAFCFVNSQKGDGVPALKRAVLALTSKVNEKRARRGMLPRAIRCAVIGFPNVGKSALINRLVQKRAAKSENRPGVTRMLNWIRISKDIELLDSPGIIPMKLVDQDTALKLAYCNDIGEAAYDAELVAATLVEDLVAVSRLTEQTFFDVSQLIKRYHVDPSDDMFAEKGGEWYMFEVAEKIFRGDRHRAGITILNDFRSGKLGAATLELPESYPGLTAHTQ